MEYVINPTWFYWLNIVDSVREVAFIYVVCFAVISLIALFVGWLCDIYEDWPDDGIKPPIKKMLVSLSITFVVAVLVLVFVPSKETLIEIQVAKLATYDNVALTVDGIKSVADYIVDAIKTIHGG